MGAIKLQKKLTRGFGYVMFYSLVSDPAICSLIAPYQQKMDTLG
jgi:hypothetical protein